MQIKGTVLFLLLSVAAFAQGGFYQDRAEGRLINGNALVAIPGAAVTVCSDSLCASPVNLYSNADLAIGHLIGTSTTADANGNFSFYVLPGQYFCQIAASGFSTSINPCQVSPNVPNIQFVNGSSCTASGFANAIALLPSTGGTIDGRGCQGALSWGGTLTLNKPVNLLLPTSGAATFTSTVSPALLIASSNVTIDSGNFVLSGANLYAVRWSGASSNTTIQNMTITGSGVIADGQGGILGFNVGGAVSNIKILHNAISRTTSAIQLNANLVGDSFSNLEISGNTIFGIVGSLAGVGYGINVGGNVATGVGDRINARITNNYLEDVGRHSIYASLGHGWVISHNTIKDHSKTAGGVFPAMEISRVQDYVIDANEFDTPYGGAMEIVTQSDFPPDSLINRNGIVSNNVVRDPHVKDAFTIGTTNPSADGFPSDIHFTNNSCYSSFDPTLHCLEISSGKNIDIADNHFRVVGATNLTNVIDIAGSGETAGTSNYTDNLEFHGNTLISDSGSSALVKVETAEAGAASSITFNTNSFQGVFAFNGYFFASALTNPNFTIATPTGAATITSGFGTSPSFAFNKVSKEIQITIGSGGSATTGVLGMPTALTGWDCKVNDLNTNIVTRETAYTTTSASFTAASAWTAGDKLLITCGAF